MNCQVKTDSKGRVTEVLAENGKKSGTYENLLNIVSRMTDKTAIQNQFKDWVGRHINNINDDKELALGLYKQLYSPMFKDWFGKWDKLAEVVSQKDDIKGYYKFSFDQNPQKFLYEIASQANSSLSEKQGAIAVTSENIVRIAQELFPDAKSSTPYSSIVGETDINGEPLIINDTYSNANGDLRDIFQKNAGSVIPSQSLYQLTGSSKETIPSKASRETIAAIKEFLARVGVNLEPVTNMVVNGRKIGADGTADAVNRLVQIAIGKEDTALPEEGFHIAVEIIAQKDPALFKQMMDKVNRYNMYDKVLQQYRTTYITADGKPDIPKIKKEAIAKILAETFIRDNQETVEKPEFLAQTKTWWQNIIDSLKRLFLRAGIDLSKPDPFHKAIGVIRDKSLTPSALDSAKAEQEKVGVFLQKTSEPLSDKLQRLNQHLSYDKDEDSYELDGNKVKSVDDAIAKTKEAKKRSRFEERSGDVKKADRAFTRATEGVIKQDIDDIFRRYINDDGNLRVTPLDKTGTSAIDPNDQKQEIYKKLEENMQARLTSYPPGSKFYHDINIYSDVSKIAGTVDFMVVKPNGKVDVFQFKAPEIKAGRSDIDTYKQSEYNNELEEIRKILKSGYGVRDSDFGQIRTIPIRADYSRVIPGDQFSPLSKIEGLRIGDVDVKKITEDTLVPIPSTSETTGIKKFDELIGKLRGLLEKVKDSHDPDVSSLDKSRTIAQLYNSIKKLQVQRSTTALLTSAKTINKRQQERYDSLSKIVEELNPNTATREQMTEISNKILEDREETEIYAHMDDALHKIFNDRTPENLKILAEAAGVSQDSRNISDNFLDLARKLQVEKYAASVGIRDEMNPEKQLTWYRRMVRSLSQSHSTAGKLLWKLVQKINNDFHIRFQDRLNQLEHLIKGVDNWMKGKTLQDFNKKFFLMDKKGRWTGQVIKKYDPQFYKDLQEAKEKGNKEWVRNNIDMKAYDEWFQAEWRKRIELANANRNHEDDAINEQIKIGKMNDWLDIYMPTRAFVNTRNYMLKEFPLDKHFSKEYKELNDKPENKPILDLYKRWEGMLKRSVELGMIDEHQGWSWFPNVKRNFWEKMTTAKAGGKFRDFLLSNTRIDTEDAEFGKINRLTGQSVNEIHARYVTDLAEKASDMDGNYWDTKQKSMDVFKVMALWEREMIKFELKTEAEGIAKMLLLTEQNRGSYKVKASGKLLRDENDMPVPDNNNEKNATYLQDHIESLLYGKNMVNETNFIVNVPVKAIAEKMNKLAGREIVPVPEQESIALSGIKGLSALNRWFALKTLGVNVLSPIANLFGGTFNSYLNQGKYFNKAEFAKAEIDLVSGKFYGTEQAKKLAAFLAYLQPYVEDKTLEQTRHLSVSGAVKYFSSDQLMRGMRFSDNVVNQHIAIAFINNAILRDGKIQNIRQVAREELDHEHEKYKIGADGGVDIENTKAWNEKLEARVKELRESPEALLNIAEIKNDKLELPGLDLHNQKESPKTVQDFRNIMIETIKDALGNTSREDMSLYKRQVLYQSFAMFKNWIPRMVDVRGQSLRYNAGTDQYEWGRMRMLGNALMHNFTGTIAGLFKSLGGNDENLINIARKSYQKMREDRERELEDFDMTEAEYTDMFVKGVAAQFKEMGLAIAFIGVLIAARLNTPDKDEDPALKGSYKWMLRGLDKLQDEVSFFYNPQSFSDIVNGSIFPAASLLLDAERFAGAMVAGGFYSIIGDDQRAGQQHPGKYLFRMMPVTKELLNYLAIMDTDLAKKWDLRVSSRNGSSR